MDNDPDVTDLVHDAADGSQHAWDCLVDRYTPLVMSVIRRHRLDVDDAQDAYQTVWLRLVEHLARIEEPRALPGWLTTTARHECLRLIRARARVHPLDPTSLDEAGLDDGRQRVNESSVEDGLLRQERHQALLAAFAELPDHQRALLMLLLADPPMSYEEIGRRLDVSVGYIGPTRSRALDRLRRSPHLRALSDHTTGGGGGRHDRTAVA